MHTASSWRLALAQTIAKQYAALPDVHAAFVGGSTARQQADRYSDLEMAIIWTAAPTEQQCAEIVARLDGDMHCQYPYDAQDQLWEDVFFMGRNLDNIPKSGCQVEMSHFLLPTLEGIINSVLLDYNADEAKHNLMAGIRDSIPFVNAPLIDAWKARLCDYPDGLQLAVIRRHGIIDNFKRGEMFIARGNNRMEFMALLTAVLHHALHLLLGLNRVFYGGFKWLDATVAQLPLAPTQLGERIRRIYELPPPEAATAVESIVEETFILIETHVSGVDVVRFRQIFRYERPQWLEPPPLAMPI